nr:hypothetical protein [Mycoplasmopsis synoviae]
MLANLTSLKESLESLQTLVSDGLKMQVDYPQKYYDADNKEAFDAALLKASSVFPAFKWTNESIVVPQPEEGALPNPRAWTKARDKSEFVLQNFLMAPAQAASATQSDLGATAAASAIVRVATGEAASTDGAAVGEAQTTPAPTPAADLASTVSYLKTLETELKTQSEALNGETPTTKTAYYKPVNGRTLYWDGFMPKIVVPGYQADGEGNGKATHEDANKALLQQWFATSSNWEKLAEQLTKKLGSDKFKNVVLTSPMVSYEDTSSNTRVPKVTFTLIGKDGYTLQTDNGATSSLTLSIRVLYTSADATQNALRYQGASPTAASSGANTADHAKTIKDVNVYLNYTGPAIVLNADLPTVGGQDNTSINGTSNVDGAFNTAFRGNPSSGLLFTNRYANPLLKPVINYVNKFDPKYRAEFVTNATNGVTITKVQSGTQLRPGTLDDLVKNDRDNVFLQQVHGDSSAVYFAVTAIASNNWLNTFLIRIPLTKFVRPISVFQATTAAPQDAAQISEGQGSQPDQTGQTV